MLVGMACNGSTSGATAVGELGNGTFDYYCAGSTDPVCQGGLPAINFPDCLMLGGSFEIGYTVHDLDELHDWGYEFVYVKPASASFFGGVDTITALRVGRAAFVAYADDNVIDILHLDIATPDGIVLKSVDLTEIGDGIEVEVGSTVAVHAYASTTGCAQPGGSLPVTVASSDIAIATADVGTDVLVEGQAEGLTTVTVTMAGVVRSFEVLVIPAAVDPTTDTDATTSGSDTDATTETGIIVNDTSATETGSSDGTDGTSDSSGTGTETGATTGSTG